MNYIPKFQDATISLEVAEIRFSNTGNDVYSGKNGQAPEVRYNGRFR